MPGIYVFDLETKFLADEVGGWSHIDKMGFAAGVIYDAIDESFTHYTEEQVSHLINLLTHADMVIGFNLLRFDYTVLKPYGLSLHENLTHKSVDLLTEIYQQLGFRVGLGNLAEATLGESKSADGIQSVQWYREGNIAKVLKYCEQDVRVTHELWRRGLSQGHVFFRDRRGRRVRVEVAWPADPDAL